MSDNQPGEGEPGRDREEELSVAEASGLLDEIEAELGEIGRAIARIAEAEEPEEGPSDGHGEDPPRA